MRLEGSLDAFSLPDIFALLSMTKKTGGLHLRQGDAHGAVWLADGLLTGGSSDVTRESLGRRLAGSGQVSDEDLADAVRVAAAGEVGVARALRDAAAIDEGELHTLLCEHINDAVFDLMRWSDGEFAFVVDEANHNDVGVTRDVDEVVSEARRRLEVWATIDATVADPATVLSVALEPGGDPTLSREEWALVAMIDGNRSVGDLVAICGRGDYSVVVALAELVSRGLLRADDSEGVGALARRQHLLASLETSPAAAGVAAAPDTEVATAPSVPVADPFPRSPELAATTPELAASTPELAASTPNPLVAVPVPGLATDSAEDEDIDDKDDDAPLAGVSPISRSPQAVGVAEAVSPARPEPLLPARQPDHPEPLAAAVVGGGVVTGAVPATNPSGAIERDPSVNKSLLLRLIAGVRGL